MTRFCSLLALAAAVLATGCASRIRTPYPEGASGSEVVVHDDSRTRVRLVPQSEIVRYVPPVEIQRTANRKAPLMEPTRLDDSVTTRAIVFVVAPPEWATEKAFSKKPEAKDEVLFTVRERFYRYLLRSFSHPVRVRYAYRASDPLITDCRVITITSRVTDLKKGNGTLRYLFGYGLGQARVQIEGEIYEGTEMRRIGDFVARRGHGGYSQGGFNLEVLDSQYVLQYAADAAITEVTKVLSENMIGVDVVPARDAKSNVASTPATAPATTITE